MIPLLDRLAEGTAEDGMRLLHTPGRQSRLQELGVAVLEVSRFEPIEPEMAEMLFESLDIQGVALDGLGTAIRVGRWPA